ncbi:MAG: LPS export ABC transporter periplasmic protein LptC [Chitinophagaceae bacterium]
MRFTYVNMNPSFTVRYILKAAAIVGCFFMVSCENSLQEVRGLSERKTGVEEAVNIDSYLSTEGKMRARLTAPLMYRYMIDTPRVEFPKTLHVDFYTINKQIETKLDARFGRYLENDNKVLLKDSVVVITVKGDTLLTDELYWDQLQQIFYTDKPVKILKPADKIFSKKGLRATQDLKSITLFNINPDTYLSVADSAMPVVQ